MGCNCGKSATIAPRVSRAPGVVATAQMAEQGIVAGLWYVVTTYDGRTFEYSTYAEAYAQLRAVGGGTITNRQE